MGRKANAALAGLLIIALAGLAYEGYTMITLQQQVSTLEQQLEQTGVVHTWYSRTNETWNVNTSIFKSIDPLNTTIDVSAGEWVYISFTSNARIQITGVTQVAIHFAFSIDGDVQWAPNFYFLETPDTDNDNEWRPVTFFAIYQNISAGAHEISIHAKLVYDTAIAQVGGPSTYYGSTLLVETIRP